jgi:hypothetical protein
MPGSVPALTPASQVRASAWIADVTISDRERVASAGVFSCGQEVEHGLVEEGVLRDASH